ncbi:MAG: SLOG family protein [Proteobacteria bacterium]|nr:SLOG family protein [Pseudomonadota bacterium]
MKLIVCGALDYSNRQLLSNTLRDYTKKNQISTLVIGTETGAETLAAEWAMANKMRLSIVPTQRKAHGDSAIIERNKELIRRHSDVKAVLHFAGCQASEDLCTRALSSHIAVDDVFPLTND